MKITENLEIKRYYDIILNNITYYANKNGIGQAQLAQRFGCSQSLISKILTGKARLTIDHLIKFSMILQIPIEELFLENFSLDLRDNNRIRKEDLLIKDPENICFKGYVNKVLYLYFNSTISTENKIIYGKIEINENKNIEICELDLKLYTGDTDADGNNIYKEYKGQMIISITLQSCYCILKNDSIGEMCFLIFNHIYLHHEDLICRMAVAITTSAGSNRRPTMHRAVISKYKFDISHKGSEDLTFLRGQLKLNNSNIEISGDEFKNVLNELEQDSELINFFKAFEKFSQKKEYYVIEEAYLRSLPFSTITKILGISMLRNHSTAPEYNKISAKTDEYIFKYLQNRQKGSPKPT